MTGSEVRISLIVDSARIFGPVRVDFFIEELGDFFEMLCRRA